MELILSNHSSYPRIGESADLQLLRRTIAQWEKQEKTDADLAAALDRLTELALAEQAEAGLEVVTDGQIRWYDPISHLAGRLEGVRINGLLRFFDTNFYFRQPVLGGAVRRTKPLIVDEFRFARAKSKHPVKPVLTGAGTLARLSIEASGATNRLEKRVEEFSAALAEETAALAEAGATLIQVEEPSLLRHPEDFPLVERSLAALAARKGQAQLALALYFGDAAPLYSKLQKLPVDVLTLDFTYSPKLTEVIGSEGSAKTLGLGLMDGRNTRLEDADAVARQLERLSRGLAGARAFLTTSCGLEYLPRDRAQLKLRHLSSIRQKFLGSQA
jgi:5-methyltetrahydropteroyltriglutamate--homocysteine methyltransferase